MQSARARLDEGVAHVEGGSTDVELYVEAVDLLQRYTATGSEADKARSLRKRVSLVTYWTIWCPLCKKKHGNSHRSDHVQLRPRI